MQLAPKIQALNNYAMYPLLSVPTSLPDTKENSTSAH